MLSSCFENHFAHLFCICPAQMKNTSYFYLIFQVYNILNFLMNNTVRIYVHHQANILLYLMFPFEAIALPYFPLITFESTLIRPDRSPRYYNPFHFIIHTFYIHAYKTVSDKSFECCLIAILYSDTKVLTNNGILYKSTAL